MFPRASRFPRRSTVPVWGVVRALALAGAEREVAAMARVHLPVGLLAAIEEEAVVQTGVVAERPGWSVASWVVWALPHEPFRRPKAAPKPPRVARERNAGAPCVVFGVSSKDSLRADVTLWFDFEARFEHPSRDTAAPGKRKQFASKTFRFLAGHCLLRVMCR